MNTNQLFGVLVGGIISIVAAVIIRSDVLGGYGFGCVWIAGFALLMGRTK